MIYFSKNCRTERVNLKIYVSSPDTTHSSVERISTLQKVFAKMKFALTLLTKVMIKRRRGQDQSEKTVSVPIIRNNHYLASNSKADEDS